MEKQKEATMTSTGEPMGRLERVDLREAWGTEDGDFTPWLAHEENITLLGDAIGVDLEVEAREMRVGLFRADIVCLDTASLDNHWVLIENQLNRTDHTHLGQLMTYAAGLDAVTIIWIAREFTDEHSAALDWLNKITDADIRFFGIEVELWRIGDSPPAPKFNIVSKPNDWTKSASKEKHKLASDYSDTQLLQLEYWGALQELMQQRQGNVNPRRPRAQHWMTFSLGIDNSQFVLLANFSVRKNLVTAGLQIQGNDHEALFALLHEDSEEIEQELDMSLTWDERPTAKYCIVDTALQSDEIKNRDNWPELLNWMYEKLEALHRVFAPRIKTLDASDYIPGETDLDDTEDEPV